MRVTKIYSNLFIHLNTKSELENTAPEVRNDSKTKLLPVRFCFDQMQLEDLEVFGSYSRYWQTIAKQIELGSYIHLFSLGLNNVRGY